MKKKGLARGIVAALLVGGLLIGCGLKSEPGTTPGADGSAAGNVSQEEQESRSEQQDDIVVSTKYGNLYYPEQWSEYVQTEQQEDENSVTVTFTANIRDGLYPLFAVMIGEGEGEPVGRITDSEGKERDVYLRTEELSDMSGLTEGEQNRLYAMQEDLNYLIDSLE